ncbi:Type I restriction-modification protein subunit M [Bosea sp. 62]|uniref:type I restriction-modification system subunit M n=1 Tax=unclassified Bosea (in: a-proteobacteria) TaxID=2653178 RepID=UPI0012561279|nr:MULTISPECIES: type I restriction-modification system subunit M [unclassified Bosea (in: a-proteobacteria)]CAD5257282.1 Type I restriction-modification protein subunit M [Bosea sp. 7B]CAD5272997.1 Type I restriction-modification protein subunit M [Bosea sp. 21B]CAD5285136.1 Type I restriction-modification protein subunit M [Bosea sp. 46]VVT60256.1 Type I restriction-modification protein subunit M [Bosea sp. EC-HK365B]VXB61219.1 Type I restriction-modification protein subunit M [Bosea sp. 62]
MTALRQDDILSAVWRACDTFRGAVDATQYKDYILTVLFLKYISDVRRKHIEEFRREFGGDEFRIQRRLDRERFKLPGIELKNAKTNAVEEKFLADFYSLHERRSRDNIGELINIALDAIEKANEGKLGGLFRAIDFNSETNLGQARDRNRRLKTLLEDFAKPGLDLSDTSEDVLGDAYIFLIEKFASDAGKKAGEFFTPRKVSEVVAKLAHPKSGDRICDPACGSGSLLLRAGEEVSDGNYQLFGQESNGQTRSLARLNMLLHKQDGARIDWCDTLNTPTLIESDHLMRFDVVVANPPFSLDKWNGNTDSAGNALPDPYKRFTPHMPPKSRGDYAFILHMLAITRPTVGRMAVVAPHGVLFRSGAEGRIREKMIRDNLLDAVIGLPAQLFPTTGIPVCIMVFDRAREDKGLRSHERDILFIDASRDFEASKKQSRLRDEDVAKIIDTYRGRIERERYSHKASFEEIEENGFNLNIPRYVDTFEPEPEVDLQAVQNEIRDLESKLAETRAKMNFYLKELGIDV